MPQWKSKLFSTVQELSNEFIGYIEKYDLDMANVSNSGCQSE